MTTTVTLNDGTIMPQLGLGVWQNPADETAQVVRAALDAGYTAVDTAAIYANEEGVGEALEGRDDVFLTTKLWNVDQGYDSAMRAFEASAAKLRRETIDLYLIHWPSPHRGLYVDSWKALVELQRQGRVRAIGVSNFMPEHLERIIGEIGVVPAANQIELHPRFQQRDMRAFHAKHGIATISWSPLGMGKILADPVLGGIAAKHGKSVAQVILRWHLDQGLIAIPKSVTPSRIAENIALFDFALDEGDLAAIAGLDDAGGRIGPDPLTATF